MRGALGLGAHSRENRSLAPRPTLRAMLRPLCLLLSLLSGAAPLAQERPHLVVFLVDDLGWQDLSVPLGPESTPFNQRYRTPAAERLAAEGMRFTNAYAASPVCTPTRVALMTGMSPARHGSTNWILHAGRGPGARHASLTPPDWDDDGLQEGEVSLPALLREAGYFTIHAGKAHLGALETSGADPTRLGFDVNIAGHAPGGPGSYYGEDHYSATRRARNPSQSTLWDVPGLEAYHGTSTHLTQATTLEALSAVEGAVQRGERFFLHLAHYAVHAPIMPDPRYVDEYAQLHATEAAYASMVAGVDASLAALLAKLEQLGVLDETLIVYTSDNGGLSAHARGGEPHTHNAPLRSGKGSSYEGGVRVPLLVRWPGRVRASSRCDVPVITHDLFPTLLAAAGTAAPAAHAQRVDGLDLAPLWAGRGAFDAGRVLGWHYPHQWGAPGPGIHPYSALRRGHWKLIYRHADQGYELYDLAADLSEQRDLASERPDLVRLFAGELGAWLEERGAGMPTRTDSGERVPLPGLD